MKGEEAKSKGMFLRSNLTAAYKAPQRVKMSVIITGGQELHNIQVTINVCRLIIQHHTETPLPPSPHW